MSFEGLFRDFWWLIFPIFGMLMAVWGMIQSDNRSRQVISLIKSYTDQGKEPPPELLKLVSQGLQEGGQTPLPSSRQHSGVWTFVVFAAMAAGFGVGWYMVRDQDFAFAFALVGVVMGVMAVGALMLLIFGRK